MAWIVGPLLLLALFWWLSAPRRRMRREVPGISRDTIDDRRHRNTDARDGDMPAVISIDFPDDYTARPDDSPSQESFEPGGGSFGGGGASGSWERSGGDDGGSDGGGGDGGGGGD